MELPVLNIKKISHSFQDLRVLEKISIKLQKREFLSVLGPSGCGKSTLLNIVSGLLVPTTGNVFLADRDITGLPGYIAHMHQKDLLLPWKSVLENVAVPSLLRGVRKKLALSEAFSHLDKFGLKGFENYYPAQLSGGMRQRVSLMRTWLYGKSLMVLDEPFGALDAITREKMQLWLLSLVEKIQATVLMVTHDVDEAILLSDRILVLSGRPAKIVDEIVIPFDHPRERKLLLDPLFSSIKGQLWDALRY